MLLLRTVSVNTRQEDRLNSYYCEIFCDIGSFRKLRPYVFSLYPALLTLTERVSY